MSLGGLITPVVGNPLVMFVSVMICGGMFSYAMHQLRNPIVIHIREQLLARSECLHIWGTDPYRVQLAGVLCKSLATAKGWPNARFIPEDPIELAFFEVSGVDCHLEILEVGAALAKKTGQKINWRGFFEISASQKLMLVDLLEASLKK